MFLIREERKFENLKKEQIGIFVYILGYISKPLFISPTVYFPIQAILYISTPEPTMMQITQ